LNTSGLVNLANISYAGANPDLIAIATAPAGKISVAFSFNDPLTLDDLRNSDFSTAFAGTMSTSDPVQPPVEPRVPDGGATTGLLGFGIAGFGLARCKMTA